MTKTTISSVVDIEDFLNAYNKHDWDAVFDYISDDCVWDASERRLEGRQEIVDYWTNYHAVSRKHWANLKR